MIRQTREEVLQSLQREIGNVSDQQEIDKGRQSDIVPVENKAEQEHYDVYYYVECSEVYRDDAVKTRHQ